MPYDHHLTFQDGRPLIYDSGDYPATLDKVKKLVGWDEFEAFRAEARAAGRRVGIGLACYVEGTGVGPYEGAHVRVETNGTVVVATGLTTQGQGHETAFAQVAAETLGVPVERVTVVTGDTRRFKYAVGTFASRAAVMSGNAVALAAGKVRAKALRIAAEALEADPDDLEVADGMVRVKGAPEREIALETVAVLANPLRYAFDEQTKLATQFVVGRGAEDPPVAEDDEPGLEATDWYSPVRSTFANGMHAVVVETDPETAEVRILRYCVVHDCGRLINPRIVEGQIHGGVAQGVGGALYERMVYDENGQLLNASFMDFLMPYASEVPKVETDHLETPSPLNPLGIKGAGEAGTIPGAAVLAAAISDAEGFFIDQHADLPVGAVGAARPPCPEGGAMRIAGNATLHAPVETVYAALRDPRGAGPDHPRLRAPRAGRRGRLPDDRHRRGGLGPGHLRRRRPPHRPARPPRLRPPGQRLGRPRHRLRRRHRRALAAGDNGTTVLSYDADAVVGGMIGGVGQRLLTGVAKRTAGDFFTAVDQVLAGGESRKPFPTGGDAGGRPPHRHWRWRERRPEPPAGGPGRACTAPPPAAGATGLPGGEFAAGVVLGAAAALLGALVGGYLARRARGR